VILSGPAEAKRVTPAVCDWFGTAPLCAGECPAGWTQTKRSGNDCVTGSKARCWRGALVGQLPADPFSL